MPYTCTLYVREQSPAMKLSCMSVMPTQASCVAGPIAHAQALLAESLTWSWICPLTPSQAQALALLFRLGLDLGSGSRSKTRSTSQMHLDQRSKTRPNKPKFQQRSHQRSLTFHVKKLNLPIISQASHFKSKIPCTYNPPSTLYTKIQST